MKRTVQFCLFVAMFVVLLALSPPKGSAVAQQTTAAQQTQQGEEEQKFAVRQGQGEFDPKIITSGPSGSSCFRHTFGFFNVGDSVGNLRLPATLGGLASEKAEMKIEIRGNLQWYPCTPEESARFDILDPTGFKYQNMVTRKIAYWKKWLSRDWDSEQKNCSPQLWEDMQKNKRKIENLLKKSEKEIEEEIRKMSSWITVSKDQAVWFKSGNNYSGIRPTEFVPMWNSVDEMPKIYQGGGTLVVNHKSERYPGWKEKWPYSTPPPIWKSAKYDWVRWTPARNQEDALVLRTLSGNGFNIAGVIFSWDSPVLNPAPSAGSALTLNYKAKYTSMAFCLLKQSDISSVDPSLLEFRQAPLDRNYAGSISVETGDVLVFLLDDKNWLAIRPVRVEKSGQFTAVFYERKRGPITPSVASTKKGDLATARSAK